MSSSVLSAGLIPCCPSPLIYSTLLGSRESPTSQDINYFQFNILSQVYIYNRTTYSSTTGTVLNRAASEALGFSRFQKRNHLKLRKIIRQKRDKPVKHRYKMHKINAIVFFPRPRAKESLNKGSKLFKHIHKKHSVNNRKAGRDWKNV